MLPDINLLPKYERPSQILYALFLILLILSVALIAAVLYFYIMTKQDYEVVEQELSNLNEQKTLLEARLSSAYESDGDIVEMENAIAYADYHRIPTSQFIDELMTILPENGFISNYNYNYQTVQLHTEMPTRSSAANYLSSLLNSSSITNVMVNQMNTIEQTTDGLDEGDLVDLNNLRYNVNYSISVNQRKLKEEAELDE